MPSEKRQRQDEGRLLRLEEQRVATHKVQRKRQFKTFGMIVLGVVLAAGAYALLTSDDASVDTSATTIAGETTGTGATGSDAAVDIVLPGAGESITGDTPCPAADGSAKRTTDFEKAPPMCIDPAKSYTATLKTTEGDIVIALDSATAPITVNNFVVLSRYHFYDGVPFHRIVTGFVNQAGDPVGPEPGTGGPGYTIKDELPADPSTAYPAGTVAMANTGQPDSGGSQFFLVIGDADGALSTNGSYAVFGKITKGEDISEKINTFANAEQQPTKVVAITSVEIAEA